MPPVPGKFAEMQDMKLPVWAYGHSILTQQCKDIDRNYPNLDQLIRDMWETMQHADGCGLAAPQVGRAIRVFVVDSKTTYDHMDAADRQRYFDKDDRGIMETFINARITGRSEELWDDEEGCLSIPGISQKVRRNRTITIEYCNERFEPQVRTFSGTTARMIQHEYDHTEGILYLDHLQPLTRKLISSKLRKIAKGQIRPGYPMKFI